MACNTYWLLSEKRSKGSLPLIVEFTADGVAYIWPAIPDTQMMALSPDVDQDLDALLADGDFLERAGLFHNIADFMNYSKYTPARYEYSLIGDFASIRSCRAAMT